MIQVGILGYKGRMGQALLECAKEESFSHFCISTLDVCDFETSLFQNALEDFLEKSDVVIDFTNKHATLSLLETNKKHKKPLVVGSTGFSVEEISQIKKLGQEFALFFSPNFSLTMHVFYSLVEQAGKILNMEKDFDVEIIEAHHRHKKDAPGGSTQKLIDVVAKATGRTLEDTVFDRTPSFKPRDISEIGVSILRAGDIVGEHSLLFASMGERLELKHTATSRATFAKGALFAADFVCQKKCGFFEMKDLL